MRAGQAATAVSLVQQKNAAMPSDEFNVSSAYLLQPRVQKPLTM
jgi:hypothetical protein